MALFLNAVIYEFSKATNLLERKARGDYSSDQHLETLPVDRPIALNGPKASKSGQTCFGLCEAYVKANKPAASTVNRWRVVFPVRVPSEVAHDSDLMSPTIPR
jgi:hypothetical protein